VIHRAVLFDMDGVIVDTERAVTAFWQKLAAAHHIHISEGDFAVHVYGRPAGDTFDALFPHLSDEERAQVTAEMRAAEMDDSYAEIPGAIEFIRSLHRHRIPLALVTSGRPWKVSAVTQQLGIEGCFEAIITAGDIQVGKPDPQCYLLAADRLRQAAAECIVFEDAVSGVQAAVAAGATCIGVASVGREEPLLAAGATAVIPNFAEAALSWSEQTDDLPLRLQSGNELMFHLQPTPSLGP
jgi:HAD superfamily hydrolase (TIGR01509 family)